jgi:hypothetical protein
MQIKIIFIALVVLLGCSPAKVSISKLTLKNSLYYYLQTKQPYTGEVLIKFDNGKTASVINIKNGVPDGRWVAYGYQGEIVQEGVYQPVDISTEFFFKGSDFIRLNVCTTKEGSVEFTDIFLVTNTPEKTYSEDKDKILAFLKTKSINIIDDNIHEIKYVTAEVEN